jgi:hypothetical protein|tara:strand:- start:523 stop:771 length:249 start_codon:yes stop_codon:yes gene_type:complete
MKINGIQTKKNNEVIILDIESEDCCGYAKYNVLKEEIVYCTYDEKDDEDVYSFLHDWVDRNIDVEISVSLKRNNDLQKGGVK